MQTDRIVKTGKSRSKKVKPPTLEEIESMVEEKAEKIVQSRFEERDSEQVDTIPQYLDDRLETDNETMSPEEKAGFDIFDFIEKDCKSTGVIAKFRIYKNGEFSGERYNPYSWMKLQKELGGGQYRIVAKTHPDNHFLKQQSLMVTEPPPVQVDEKDTQDAATAKIPFQMPGAQFDPNQLVTVFQSMYEMANKSREREDKEDKSSSTALLTTFSTMIGDTQKQNQEMFMKMQDSTTRMIEKSNENFLKLIEKMDDKFQKMMESDTHKKQDNMTAFDILKLVENAKSEGFNQMKILMELADAKAEEKAEMYADREPQGDGSMIGSLVKAVIPLLQATGKQMALPAPAVTPTQEAAFRAEQQRRYNEEIRRRKAAQSQPRAGANQNATASVERVETVTGPNQSTIVRNNLGLPTITDNVKDVPAVAVNEAIPVTRADAVAESVVQQPNPSSEDKLSTLYQHSSPEQQQIATLAIPLIAEQYTINAPPKVAAEKVLKSLEENRVPAENVIKHFSFEFLCEIVRSFGIAEDAIQTWFKEFYANIETSARMVIRGRTTN